MSTFIKEQLSDIPRRKYRREYYDFINSVAYTALISEVLDKNIGRISKSEVNYRKISHWAKKNVIFFSRTNGELGWKSITAKSHIWFMIVRALRDLDIGLERIRAIKDDLLGADNNEPTLMKEFAFYVFKSIALIKIYLIIDSKGRCDLLTGKEFEIAQEEEILPNDYISIDFGEIVRETLRVDEILLKQQSINDGGNTGA